MAVKTEQVVAVMFVAAAAGLAYAATRGIGPIPPAEYSEDLGGPLMEHLVTEAEMLTAPVYLPQRYPVRVGPQISNVIQRGYSPLYQPLDPQVAALPSELGV